jgi:hypothetical protein
MADLEQIRGKHVVAVVDFHETIIYVTDAPRQRPERLVATDPHGRFTKSTIAPETFRVGTKTTVRRTGMS